MLEPSNNYVKKPRRKPKDSPTAHLPGTLSDIILGKQIPIKYDDPRNLVVIV